MKHQMFPEKHEKGYVEQSARDEEYLFLQKQKHRVFEREQDILYAKIIDCFQTFLYEFEFAGFDRPMKHLFYAVLKIEGDILIDLNKIDLAIKCFKTLKDYCDNWDGLDY